MAATQDGPPDSARVVVTGMGAITPVGNDVETMWRNLQAGLSVAHHIDRFDSSRFRTRFAAEVVDFDPTDWMDPKEARRSPELAVLSAVAHGGSEKGEQVLRALWAGFDVIDDDRIRLYADYVLRSLPAAAKCLMEELMRVGTYEYQSDFARKYFYEGKAEGKVEGKAEGEAEGLARAILTLLEVRGIAVPEEGQERLYQITDLDRLDEMLRRATTVESVDALFA